MTVMERDEIERIERELDAILKLVQPEAPMQDKTPGMDTDQETAEKQKIKGFKEMAREEWAFSGEQEEIGVQNMPNKAPGEEEIKNEEQPPSQEHAPEDAAKDSRKEKRKNRQGRNKPLGKRRKRKNPAFGIRPGAGSRKGQWTWTADRTGCRTMALRLSGIWTMEWSGPGTDSRSGIRAAGRSSSHRQNPGVGRKQKPCGSRMQDRTGLRAGERADPYAACAC